MCLTIAGVMRDVNELAMLSAAVVDTKTVDRREALRLAMTTVEHRNHTRDIAIETTIALLTGGPSAPDRAALKTLHEAATDDPRC
jgi:hypothetical protein